MADKNSRYSDNIPGKYYVDDSCISCDACCVEAPKFFAMNDNEGHAYVMLQPQTPEEMKDAENALAACPVEAIGNNG
jgi:ferredoxin